jgi:hypothetical protein
MLIEKLLQELDFYYTIKMLFPCVLRSIEKPYGFDTQKILIRKEASEDVSINIFIFPEGLGIKTKAPKSLVL